MTDHNGTETTYTYNLYGSIIGRRAQNPQALGTKLFEAYEYTPEGLLKSAISSGSAPGAPNVYTMGMRYSYEYDAMGRLTKKAASGRILLSFAYDLNGNLTRQEDVTGKVTEYSYNELDILESVNDNGNILAKYTYYPDGAIRSLQSGSFYTEYAYDADKNLASLKTLLGDEVLVDNHYTYDHNGNRTEKQQLGGSTRYTYDGLNQLTRVEYPGYTEELYYDRAGNRRRRVSAGVEENYQYDPANHLTEYTKGGVKTTFTYDNAGNLTADDRARYTYDLFNRTEKVETFDGHVQINRYDAEGLRHEMEEDGKLVQFIFRGQEVVMEETDNNKIRHIRGYELIASDAESARTYYHYASDEMGSITYVVTGEEKEGREQNQETASTGATTGKILNRYEYDAWGNLTLCEEAVENRFKFNSQQYDPISQQYYLRARYYSPVIARFTQEDTYRGDGLNLYAYCRNNPVYYADPSGHSCDKDATQRRPEGSGSFADQLAQHVADEIAFNQEHGLTTQYDTPQAEAANRRVEQELLYHMEGMQALETAGEVRYRQGEPVEPMEMTYEFRLNPQMYAYEVAKKYGINLRGSGQDITITVDDSMNMGTYGKSREVNPTEIVLSRSAFYDEATLANTIAHELSHCRDFLRGAGTSNPQLHKPHGEQDSINTPGGERTVYGAGNALEAYIRGER